MERLWQLSVCAKNFTETAPNLHQTLDDWMAHAVQTSSPYFSHSDFTHLRFVRETKAFVYGYKRQ